MKYILIEQDASELHYSGRVELINLSDGQPVKLPAAVDLNAFNDMNEVHWANLKTMLEADPRLQLGADTT